MLMMNRPIGLEMDGQSTEDLSVGFDVIYRNACHLSGLLDDVLELAQIDAHRLAIHREPV